MAFGQAPRDKYTFQPSTDRGLLAGKPVVQTNIGQSTDPRYASVAQSTPNQSISSIVEKTQYNLNKTQPQVDTGAFKTFTSTYGGAENMFRMPGITQSTVPMNTSTPNTAWAYNPETVAQVKKDIITQKDSVLNDLKIDIDAGMPESELGNLYPDIPESIRKDLYIDIKAGMPIEEAKNLYPELYSGIKTQDTNKPILGEGIEGGLRGGVSSLAKDWGALEWINPVGKITSYVNELAQKIPTFTAEELDKFSREKLGGFGEGFGASNAFFLNIPGSFLKTLTATAQGVTNPLDTVAGLYKLVATKEGHQVLKDRYGSVEAFQRTMTEDPVGLASDVLTIAQGGANIVSKSAKLAGLYNVADDLSRFSTTAGGAANLGLDIPVSQAYGAIDNIQGPMGTVARTVVAPTRPVEVATNMLPKKTQLVDRKTINIEEPVEVRITPEFEKDVSKLVDTTVIGNKGVKKEKKFNEDMATTVDIISHYGDKMMFEDEGGNLVNKQIETIGELNEAVPQVKKIIFDEYNAKKEAAGEQGIMIETNNIIGELQVSKKQLERVTGMKSVIAYVDELIFDFKRIGKMTPDEAQRNIQIYNEKLKSYYKNANPNDIGRNAIDAFVIGKLREAQNAAIESATGGPGYEVFKDKYRAVSNVEKQISKSASRAEKNANKAKLEIGDIITADQLVNAVAAAFRGDVIGVAANTAKAIGVMGLKRITKSRNNPNRIVKKLFETIGRDRNKIFIPKNKGNANIDNNPNSSTNLVPNISGPNGGQKGPTIIDVSGELGKPKQPSKANNNPLSRAIKKVKSKKQPIATSEAPVDTKALPQKDILKEAVDKTQKKEVGGNELNTKIDALYKKLNELGDILDNERKKRRPNKKLVEQTRMEYGNINRAIDKLEVEKRIQESNMYKEPTEEILEKRRIKQAELDKQYVESQKASIDRMEKRIIEEIDGMGGIEKFIEEKNKIIRKYQGDAKKAKGNTLDAIEFNIEQTKLQLERGKEIWDKLNK